METLEKVQVIDEEGEGLTQWEIHFIAGLIDTEQSIFTDKQTAIINRIFNERVRR